MSPPPAGRRGPRRARRRAASRLGADGRGGAGDCLGLCLDSCQLLASGFEIRTPDGLAAVLDECAGLVGLQRLGSLHLNDSETPLGSNRDRHANVGKGEIGADGCAVFLSEPRFEGLPCVLETPGPNRSGSSRQELALALALRLRKRGLAARRDGARYSTAPSGE